VPACSPCCCQWQVLQTSVDCRSSPLHLVLCFNLRQRTARTSAGAFAGRARKGHPQRALAAPLRSGVRRQLQTMHARSPHR
jgi:hypothetical protein